MAREAPNRLFRITEREVYHPQSGELIAVESIREQVTQLLADLAIVGDRVGGTIAVIFHREETEPDQFVTDEVLVTWESFAPAKRLPRAEPAAKPEPEPEPEPAEEDILDEAAEPQEAEVAAG